MSRVAEQQEGVINRRQLDALGISDSKVTRWLADGFLHRRHRGVYTVGHRKLSMRGVLIAALFYAGRGAALSFTTAAWWWGIIAAEPRRIHISAPGNRRSTREINVHHPRAIDRVMHRGLPVTTVERTLLDLAAILPFDQLRRALSEAEFKGLVDPHHIHTLQGHPGSGALRKALSLHCPELAHTRSALEERFLKLCEDYAIPTPQMNTFVKGLEVDAIWSEAGLIVELDGHAAHASPARIENDRRRELKLRRAGFRVVRYTWSQITREPTAVAADLRRELS